jgi:hypothetical protein
MGLVISGANFGPAQACNFPTSPNGCVIITGLPGGDKALPVINNSWSPNTTSIQVQLPSSIPTPPTGQTYPGQIYVVTSAGVQSNKVSFSVSSTFGCN